MAFGISVGGRGVHVSNLGIEKVNHRPDGDADCLHLTTIDGGYFRLCQLNSGRTIVMVYGGGPPVVEVSSNLEIRGLNNSRCFVMGDVKPGDVFTVRFKGQRLISARIS